ncbi:hypothetical protein SFC66_13030 [Terribacillus saccharophilus]|uniref:hypothetical protein n=1 Tax=Terribacillus saccharophilus TaxID=361277 RepID=UPI0039823C7E
MEPQYRETQNNDQMKIMQWVWTLVLTAIPIVNLVMLIIWAVDKTNPRRNWAIATFIVGVAGFVIVFIISIIFTIVGVALIPETDPVNSNTYYY